MTGAVAGAQPPRGRPSAPRSTGQGFGRLLVTVYDILAFAALGRSGYELATKFSEAPVAYSLSAFSAVVYVVATIALARGRGAWRAVAWVAVSIEAVGVLTVGALSLASPDVFGESAVWFGFGQGYGYIPLVLPFAGLWWLLRTRARSAAPSAGDPGRPRPA